MIFYGLFLLITYNALFLYSNPVPNAEPFSFIKPNSNHYNVYDLTIDGVQMKEDLLRNRMQFWNNIFNDYNHLWNTSFKFNLNCN